MQIGVIRIGYVGAIHAARWVVQAPGRRISPSAAVPEPPAVVDSLRG